MCKMPDPEKFQEMSTKVREEVFYSVLSKLASRARFTNWVIPLAFTTLLVPAVTWVWKDGEAQDKRIESLEDRVERRAIQDSMAYKDILRAIKDLDDDKADRQPLRRSARR